MSNEGHISRYHQHQRGTEAWQDDRQQKLKRRVFETFCQWLEINGHAPLQTGQRVLDVGSGSGVFVECCRDAGIEAQGVDIGDGVDLEADPLPVDDNSIDVITSISVIEHLHSPNMMLTEMMRVMKPGSAAIFVCPNWKYSVATFFDDPTHVHPYSPESLAQILKMYGFENIEIVPWLVKKPSWMWFLPRRFFVAYRLLPFRGDAPRWIPEILKGRSASMLAFASKPNGSEL